MFFSGMTYCQSDVPYMSLQAPGNTLNGTVSALEILSGIFDTVYIGSLESVNALVSSDDVEWDLHTILLGRFQNNLSAGNLIIDYLLSQIDSITIKRRISGSLDEWLPLFHIPINSESDFQFVVNDYYAKAKTEYEYSYTILIGNREFDMQIIKKVYSDFDGFYIIDQDKKFGSVLDISFDTSKNRPSEVVNAINSKYPFIVSNGMTNYYTGNASGIFIPYDFTYNEWDVEQGAKYRDELMNFLCDGKPKFLKYRDGRAWIVNITSNPAESQQGHPDKVQVSFSWAEIGDAESEDDLYYNGLIEIGEEVI